MEKELKKALEDKFYCPSRFAQEIEKLVHGENKMSYIDAIIYFCEHNNLDLESVPKLISKPLKEKIRGEALKLNYLKRSSRAKLPLWFILGPKISPEFFLAYYFFYNVTVWML